MNSDQSKPLVSVVTPFFNSEDHLDECIQSVLCQSYQNFEYVLVDNCSTDQSRAIVEKYAAADARIRLIKATEFRGQVENYNYGLSLIDDRSRYCKLVQADDWIYPECLEEMVGVAEREPRIGIVGAYSLRGKSLRGEGLDVSEWHVPGRKAGRIQMVEGKFFTGSPTTIMYRSDLVRCRQPFYELNRYHEDTEVAYDILRDNDLGFVHQVLSYQRVDDASVMGRRSSYAPYLLDKLIVIERYGSEFLHPQELDEVRSSNEKALIRFLGFSLLRRRDADFWKYQKGGFASMGRAWPMARILGSAVNQALDLLLNPKFLVERLLRRLGK